MMGAIAEWMPADCLGSRAATQPFEQMVQAWTDKWFHAAPWRVIGEWTPVDETATSTWSTLRASSHGFAMMVDEGGILRLALDVLAAEPQARYTDSDLRLLRRLAGKVLDDFDTSLSDLPRSAAMDVGPVQQRVALRIGHSDRPCIMLCCPMSRLIPVVRAGLPRMHKGGGLHSPIAATREQAVQVAALLGHARLSIADIRQFEVGDIVMLDKPSADPVTLAVSDRETAITGHLGERKGQIIFEVAELR